MTRILNQNLRSDVFCKDSSLDSKGNGECTRFKQNIVTLSSVSRFQSTP